MHRTNKYIVWATLIATPVFAQERIEVFTEASTQVDTLAGVDVIHYDLSAPARVKKQLAPKLPADEKVALAQAKAFFETAEGKSYKIAMRDAYRGKQKMMQYQLSKLPAVVFEGGTYVIYGTTDVAQAVRLYRQHIQDKQE